MSWLQNQRRVGINRNSGPRQSLLSNFRKSAAEPKSEDPPLEESQLSEVYGPSNDALAVVSDPIEDDEFPPLWSPPRPKDERLSTNEPTKSSNSPIKEEEDPDFYRSFRSSGQDPYHSLTQGWKAEGFLGASRKMVVQESSTQKETQNQENGAPEATDDDLPLDLDDDDDDVPKLLIGGPKKAQVKKGGRDQKRGGISDNLASFSDGESSGDGPVSSRANIGRTKFHSGGSKKPSRVLEDIASSQGSQSGEKRRSTKRAGCGLDASYKGPKNNGTNISASTKGSATLKRKSAGDEESNISSSKLDSAEPKSDSSYNKSVGNPRFGKSASKTFSKKDQEKEQEKREREKERAAKRAKREKKLKKNSAGSDPESPQHQKKFWIPDAIESEEPSSPARPAHSRLPGAIPLLHSSSPAKKPPLSKIPARLEDTDSSSPEKSQRPNSKLLADLSDFDEPSWLNSPTTKGALAGSDLLLRRSTSPLTDLDSPIALDSAPMCPLCKKEVDKDYHSNFTKSNPVWTVQNMQRFCKGHTKHSAKAFWAEQGYPKIKWLELDDRISQHLPLLRSILEGKQSSHYSDLFKDKIKSGHNRTLLRSDELNLTPGYYGIRGLRQMSENLIHEFSAILRKRALEDNLIGARGYSTYLQAVLVPELAVRLIMDDMTVGEEEARKALRESSWVGEVLHDEIADVVMESEDDEQDDHRRRR
ncbi:RTC4-like domain-containing protein [Cladorrhinum sp. PSN332]|nr:RTC4-like domain-containing protein [Cladorrhinum sp. PSN332]